MSVQCVNPRLLQCLPATLSHLGLGWGPSPGDQEHSRALIWNLLCGCQYPGGVRTSQTGRVGAPASASS